MGEILTVACSSSSSAIFTDKSRHGRGQGKVRQGKVRQGKTDRLAGLEPMESNLLLLLLPPPCLFLALAGCMLSQID